MPDLPTLPTLRNPNLLRREVAPFGHDELRRGGLPYIDNPDAVLAHLAHGDEEQYRIICVDDGYLTSLSRRSLRRGAPPGALGKSSAGNSSPCGGVWLALEDIPMDDLESQ